MSFAAARSLYLADRTEDAARSLRSYVKSFPQGAYLTDALYYLGTCYRTSGEELRELETLEQLAAQGQNQYTLGTLERLSEAAFAQKRYATAAEADKRLSECAPTERERGAALERYVRALLAAGDREAILAAGDVVERRKEATPEALRRLRFARASILRERGQEKEALALYEQLRQEVRTAEGAEAMYRVIESKFRAGDDKTTEKMIFDFADMPSPDNYWLARAYLLLGDLYLKQGDNFQARATYQSVADGYSPADDGIVTEARSRIAKMNQP